MLITMFTDASHCSMTNIGAYAVWAKCDGVTLRKSGVMREPVPNSVHAETMAVVNGLFLAVKEFKPPRGSKIITQTDCQATIGILTVGKLRTQKSQKAYAYLRKAYSTLIGENGLNIDFRYVSGHKGTITKRNAVNTWCDKECYFQMKKARELVLEKALE